MAPLTTDRNTPAWAGDGRVGPLAADAKLFAGALVMRTTAGYLTHGATSTGAVGVGRAEDAVDNTGGANGATSIAYRTGIFRFANSSGADEIASSLIGQVCYIVDDQTVAATDGGATRSPAGIVEAIDGMGVWVRFDEALTRIA